MTNWKKEIPKNKGRLLNSHVVKKEKENENNKKLPIEKIGFVAGVITLNDEVEVIIKFSNELIQLTKVTFSEQMTLLVKVIKILTSYLI